MRGWGPRARTDPYCNPLPEATLVNRELTQKRWKPTPVLGASAALHAGAAACVMARPQSWPWMLAAVVANHLLLSGVGLWPRSKLLGSNWTSLPGEAAAQGAVAVTIDDGPDPEVTPVVLDLLDQHRAKATFFCIGERVARYPELARETVRRGHAIENHTQRHLMYFSALGPRTIADEIGRAQETIGAVTGERPRFFRAPAGFRNFLLDPVLARLDLQLASWTRRGFDTLDRDAGSVLKTLMRGVRGGHILLLHDGHAGRTPSGIPLIVQVLPSLLGGLAAAQLTPVRLRDALPQATRSSIPYPLTSE
jgi:peptidoglycan/xylan/chitin deacetylase (PgdA/CDA1 family)